MTGSNSTPFSKKRKRLTATISSVAESGGHKYSKSYQDTLHHLGITTEDDRGIIPSENEHTELPEYFPELNNLPLLSGYITSWFQKFNPNKASLVHFLRECLFHLKVSTSGENYFTILHEFSGPLKSHGIQGLLEGDGGIKFPFIKRYHNQQTSDLLQTPSNIGIATKVPCLSSGSPTCAVAIVAEVKANSLPTSIAAAKNQWSSLAYQKIME